MNRGLRVATILSYMAAVLQAHVIRGLEAPALAEGAIKTALKGLRNSLGEDSPRAVMTRQLMRQAKLALKTARGQYGLCLAHCSWGV